jgi:eukaryotic-like serine/threonine-protein kinase
MTFTPWYGSDSLAPTEPGSAAPPAVGLTQGPLLEEHRPSISTLTPGSIIGGSYRLLQEIGRGAMGVVLLAIDEQLERRVAIKLIREELANESFRHRFMQEARAMAQVNHPNVLGIYAFGEHEGAPYFVTELVEGVTLETWLLQRSEPPELPTALGILNDVCHAVSAIHAAGTVHRDLKPSNILLDRALRSRVADFGVSIHRSTVAAELAGTPAYMAPEVAMSEGTPGKANPLSDIYSLGCVAFELLTGRRPFQAHGAVSSVWQHMTEPVPLASSVRPGLPRGFDRVLRTALAKDPAARPASVEELRHQLTVSALEPERILVAEDDADFRQVMQLTLEREFPSTEVECVADGRAALEALEQRPASIALIDLSMPVLDGIALTRALRQRETSVRMPIIVLTGRGGAAEWQALSTMGADRFLVKPVHFADLVRLVRRSVAEAFGVATGEA